MGQDMTRTDTKVLTAHVPLALVEKIDQMAARLERSRGWIVKEALSAWIEQEEECNRLTKEALADVDAGGLSIITSNLAYAGGQITPDPLESG
jgi:predicted transcriptional regulator